MKKICLALKMVVILVSSQAAFAGGVDSAGPASAICGKVTRSGRAAMVNELHVTNQNGNWTLDTRNLSTNQIQEIEGFAQLGEIASFSGKVYGDTMVIETFSSERACRD